MIDNLKVVSLDPSLNNSGFCEARLNVATGELFVERLLLLKTERRPKDRRSTDDLRRLREVWTTIRETCRNAAWIIVEMPQIGGSAMQARSIWTSGLMFGLLAAIDTPLIEVSPIDTKLASVGIKTATKQQIIDWAVDKYPDANWKTKTQKGVTSLTADNEHLADSVAILHAGVQSPVVVQTLAALRRVHIQQ